MIAPTIATPKSDLDAKAEKSTVLKAFEKILYRKITSAKMQKIYCKVTIATFMQPPQYDLQCSAAKYNTITHAAVAPRNLDPTTTIQFAHIALQNTVQVRTTAQEMTAPKPDLDAKAEKSPILKAFE